MGISGWHFVSASSDRVPRHAGQSLSLLSPRHEAAKVPQQAGALPWAPSSGLMGKAGPPSGQSPTQPPAA